MGGAVGLRWNILRLLKGTNIAPLEKIIAQRDEVPTWLDLVQSERKVGDDPNSGFAQCQITLTQSKVNLPLEEHFIQRILIAVDQMPSTDRAVVYFNATVKNLEDTTPRIKPNGALTSKVTLDKTVHNLGDDMRAYQIRLRELSDSDKTDKEAGIERVAYLAQQFGLVVRKKNFVLTVLESTIDTPKCYEKSREHSVNLMRKMLGRLAPYVEKK